ncbi:MAG: 2-succinyl-5-enolpyruvyl-6-hydroxy-3-cyclohexene-1-carboxylic-acid synthase [Gemmatimonadetes bacterium]|nr:2-succinyl-5-enolpyruvyl-6-hydroxy-3-cyclohexene-1-carboxylic-acid synthase [Gemmatimonadota bacterium]
MSERAANTAWARALVDELARAGVREVVLAPGSRSTPLVMAFAADGRFRPRVHLDERSAAFFALGVGKATGVPAVVLTTSGTAAANVYPAVVEASAAEVPLLVLTADRPPRHRGADANQTIDQVRMFGGYVREFFEVPEPALEGPALRHLRSLIGRAVASAVGAPAGPVHLNVPFDKPLEPVEVADSFVGAHPLAVKGRPSGEPFVSVSAAHAQPSAPELEALREELRGSEGVIVAGPSPESARSGPAVKELAAATGFPVLADPLSGARFGPGAGAYCVAAYDLFLRDTAVAERLRPSVVLRVGSSPTSAALLEWLLLHNGVPQIVIDGGGRWKDHLATATRYVRADAADTMRALAARATRTGSPQWEDVWRRVESAALEALGSLRGTLMEGEVWGPVLASLSSGSTLFVSNSMPIRDLDALGLPREEGLDVLGNRGASGIDGVVSTAFGVASQRKGPTVCVLGDLALFHDQNGLLWSREEDAAVVFVLVDNDGGGIFHGLPIAEHEPHFSRYFATPHGLDFVHAAALHGISMESVEVEDLADPLEQAIQARGTKILRVRSDRAASHRRRRELIAAVQKSVREALAKESEALPMETSPR